MGHIKCFIMFFVVRWIWSFVSDSFVFYRIHLFSLCRSSKGLREEGKAKDTFRFKFYFWSLWQFEGVGMFCWISRNSYAPSDKGLEEHKRVIFANYKSIVCQIYAFSVGTFDRACYEFEETQCAAKFGTQQACTPPSKTEKKVVCLSRSDKYFKGRPRWRQ